MVLAWLKDGRLIAGYWEANVAETHTEHFVTLRNKTNTKVMALKIHSPHEVEGENVERALKDTGFGSLDV